MIDAYCVTSVAEYKFIDLYLLKENEIDFLLVLIILLLVIAIITKVIKD